MKVYVGVNKAVQRGRLIVNLPGALLFLAIWITIPAIVNQYTENTAMLVAACIVGFAIGFCLGWLYSGFAVVRWKIWAYENVKNLHELKEKAIKEKVIYRDGHWSEKWTFFQTDEQRQRLAQLENRFHTDDIHHDDLNVPKETAIHISKKNILFLFVLGLVLLGVAAYRYLNGQQSNALMLALLSLIPLALAYNDYRKKEPQLLISNTGIKLYKKEMMPWESISNERVEVVRHYDKHQKFLYFDFKGKAQELQINSLGTNIDDLEHLLRVYRLRYDKSRQH